MDPENVSGGNSSDLLRYPEASGGIDNVLTIFADLAAKLDASAVFRPYPPSWLRGRRAENGYY
jgi:hypothetical protein